MHIYLETTLFTIIHAKNYMHVIDNFLFSMVDGQRILQLDGTIHSTMTHSEFNTLKYLQHNIGMVCTSIQALWRPMNIIE